MTMTTDIPEPFDRTKWPINDVAIQVVEDRSRPVIRRKLELYRAKDLIDVLITEIEEGLWGTDDDDDEDDDDDPVRVLGADPLH